MNNYGCSFLSFFVVLLRLLKKIYCRKTCRDQLTHPKENTVIFSNTFNLVSSPRLHLVCSAEAMEKMRYRVNQCLGPTENRSQRQDQCSLKQVGLAEGETYKICYIFILITVNAVSDMAVCWCY